MNMLKNYAYLFLCLSCLLISCGSEDDYTPVNIETNADSATVNQNSSVDLFIFQNDSNLPTSGSLSLSNPTRGTVTINDPNNTPNNPSDDSITYTTNANTVGEDVFQYTICDNANNCSTGTVNITILTLSTVNYDLDNRELIISTIIDLNWNNNF